MQWVAGGAVAEAVIARDGEQIVLVAVPESERKAEPNLASTPIAELRFGGAPRKLLSDDAAGRHAFAQAIEEWKLLMSAALAGLSREAIRLAAAYARERVAFGQPIGSYQGIAHPLADLICDVDGGKYFDLEDDPRHRRRQAARRARRSRSRSGGMRKPRTAPSRRRCRPSADTA